MAGRQHHDTGGRAGEQLLELDLLLGGGERALRERAGVPEQAVRVLDREARSAEMATDGGEHLARVERLDAYPRISHRGVRVAPQHDRAIGAHGELRDETQT